MEFRYSNRIVSIIFGFIVFIALMEPYIVIGEKYINNDTIFWIVDFVVFITIFRITAALELLLEKKFFCFTKKGSCYIENDLLVINLGGKIYKCNRDHGIEELTYTQSKIFQSLFGISVDKLEICIKGKRIFLLEKPNEDEKELCNRELYKVFLMIKDKCNLIRDMDTYQVDFIECYRSKQN